MSAVIVLPSCGPPPLVRLLETWISRFSWSLRRSQSGARVYWVRPARFLGRMMTGLSAISRFCDFHAKPVPVHQGPLVSCPVLMLSCNFSKSCQPDRCTALRSELRGSLWCPLHSCVSLGSAKRSRQCPQVLRFRLLRHATGCRPLDVPAFVWQVLLPSSLRDCTEFSGTVSSSTLAKWRFVRKGIVCSSV